MTCLYKIHLDINLGEMIKYGHVLVNQFVIE